MKYLISICTVLAVLTVVGCDDDDDGVLDSEITYSYAELTVFNTSEYLFSKRDYIGSLSKIPEPLVNWEQSLGEPFIDVDGDDIYDPDVDSFIVSANPDSNQDLNGNGYYDSPDSAWSPGIPFDDIDNNGEFREDPGDHISGYEIGLPYADFNSNNVHDADIKAIYGIQQWSKSTWTGGYSAYQLSSRDEAVYRFVSDSHLTYDLPFRFQSTMDALILKGDGLYYYFRSDQIEVPILPPGRIAEEDQREMVVGNGQDSITITRSITFDVVLTVDNMVFQHLLEVKLEHENTQHLFYFARGDGPAAYVYRQDRSPTPGTWTDYYETGEYYLRRLPPSQLLVFSTTR